MGDGLSASTFGLCCWWAVVLLLYSNVKKLLLILTCVHCFWPKYVMGKLFDELWLVYCLANSRSRLVGGEGRQLPKERGDAGKVHPPEPQNCQDRKPDFHVISPLFELFEELHTASSLSFCRRFASVAEMWSSELSQNILHYAAATQC